MLKHTKIVQILEERIQRGDYSVQELPTEGRLAQDVGVARLTARKAVNQLIEKGLLVRLPNGRAALNRQSDQRAVSTQVCFLSPAYVNSNDANLCRIAAKKAAEIVGANLRTIEYMHWNDPAILTALNGFNGVFFKPWTEQMPEHILAAIKASTAAVAVLDQDLTAHGIRSLCPFPPALVQRLLDHLAALGHTRIDCFNIQPVELVIERRIEQWNIWKAAHGMSGKLHSAPSETPLKQGYEAMCRLIDAGDADATAFFVTTGPGAIGAIRAFHERGLRVGKDVSVCAVNDEGLGRYMIPTLTALEMPDLVPQMVVCMQWMVKRGKDWIGPLLMQPAEATIFTGESTGLKPTL